MPTKTPTPEDYQPPADTPHSVTLEPFECIPAPWHELCADGSIDIIASATKLGEVLEPMLRQTHSLVKACQSTLKPAVDNDTDGACLTVRDCLKIVESYLWCGSILVETWRNQDPEIEATIAYELHTLAHILQSTTPYLRGQIMRCTKVVMNLRGFPLLQARLNVTLDELDRMTTTGEVQP